MNTFPMIPFPTMPDNPSGWEYFWFMLPFAFPGFLTFIVGVFLAFLGLIRALKKERVGYFLSFSGTCLGFGTLGLVLALRSVVKEEDSIILWNTILYPFVLLLAPCSSLLLYYFLDKKYKVLLWSSIISWVSFTFGIIGILKMEAFTGEILYYSFGKYPVASYYLKLWGIVSAFLYFFFGIPAQVHFRKSNRFKEKRYLVIGLNILLFSLISNLPSFIGISFFPGSLLAFFPMLLLAYGVFITDFEDLQKVLFQKNGLFFLINALIGFFLLAIISGILYNFSPTDYTKVNWFPWILIPLFSFFIVTFLAILIGGTNTSNPLNQLGAICLYLYSFQLIGIVINGLPLNLIISSRLEQLIYVVFCLIPSIQLRFSFLTLKRPLPKITPIIDLISIILSMLALTPFAFMGYFEFPWGRFSASGPVVQTFGIVGLITIFIVLREWWKFKNKDNPLGNYTAIFIGVGGLMLFGNIPATMGIEFYPIGNISIFSTMILAYAVMKFGGNTIKTEALRLSYRLTPFAIFGTLLFLIFFWKFIYTKENLSESILHLLLIGLPMILLGFLFTFLLIQPIASRIDNTIDNLANAKKTTDEVKKEIEKLNEFTNLINSTSDISIIFKEIYSFLNHSMGFEHTWTLLVDKETNELYSYKSTIISSKEDKLDKDFFQSFRKKLEPSLGTLYQTYVKKVPLYIRDIHTSMEGTKNKNINIWNGEVYTGTKTDLLIIIKGKLSSISQFPLILNNEVIGILCISVFGRKLEMSREELEKVKRFSNQIVGVINNAQLLSLTARAKEEAEIEKEKALLAKKETENQKHETEELNLLIKSLNEKLDLKVIMKKVHRYVKENFGINDYGLYTVNPDKTYLKLIQSHFPVFLNEEDRETIINFQMPILGQKGAHSLAFQRKRPFYFPNVMHPRTANLITEEERFVIEKWKIQSFLMIPLILNNEPIGILDFTNNKEKMSFSKEDITRLSILGEQLAGIIYGSNLFKQVEEEKEKSEKLLLNILPKDVASELKEKGFSEPVLFDSVSVMFTDFKGFTTIAEKLSPQELVKDLDACFVQFDKISERYNLEKLKTIGDSYMCAGGIPKKNKTHAIDCILAALEIQDFMNMMKDLKEQKGFPYWELRLGIHSGQLIAGVIGEKKFAYDVWGDTVNTASRMESSGTPGKINISGETYEFVKEFFDCEYRGEVSAKNKGMIQMYYVNGLKKEFSKGSDTRAPNGRFWEVYGK